MTSCPDGLSTDEGEECRTSTSGPDDFNGGCIGDGSGFSNIALGESICGTISNYEDSQGNLPRDYDWYYFKVSTNTTVSVILTTDFDAVLILGRLDDIDPCGEQTAVALTETDDGNNTYVISANVTAGNYTIFLSSVFDGPPLFCPTPGNYTLTVINESIP